MSERSTDSNLEVKKVLNQPYKYGFNTNIETEHFPKGINKEIIKLIHKKKRNRNLC